MQSLSIRHRPTPVSVLYFGIISILLLAWIPALTGSRLGEPLLDVLLVTASATAMWSYGLRRGTLFGYQIFWTLYLSVGALLAIGIRGVNPLDFAQAYKFVWYLILLAPLAWARVSITSYDLNRMLNIALAMFFAVYLAKVFLGDDRPKLMTENNFEIVFLALLYFSKFVSGQRPSTVQTLVFLAIVVLSGSRSAAIAAALVVLASFDFKSRNAFRLLVGGLTALAGIGLALIIFENRSQGGIESIDRFKFLLMFIESIRNWTISDYLFGADRLTALPAHVCSQLAYYSVLNSYDDDGSCYSVILHSFNLRIIHDHGIVFTAITLAYLFKLTHAAPMHQRLFAIGVVLTSGLSVSALNNVFTAIGLALFCLAASNAATERKSALDIQTSSTDALGRRA